MLAALTAEARVVHREETPRLGDVALLVRGGDLYAHLLARLHQRVLEALAQPDELLIRGRAVVEVLRQLVEYVPGVGERLGGHPAPRFGEQLLAAPQPDVVLELH